MRVIVKIIFGIITVAILGYLLLPTPSFPVQLADSVQSFEEADTETPLRRSYFTNFSREQVITHYQAQMEQSFFGIPLPTYRLNHPPEDAFRLIRDQTKSTYLEEIVHPLRESLFVNGFIPTEPKDAIGYRGVAYNQKTTLKYTPSSVVVRIFIFGAAILLFWKILDELFNAFRKLFREWFERF